MASNFPEFDDRDRQMHADNEILIARSIANRDQLEAYHRDAKGRRKAKYAEILASADKSIFEFRSGHEVFTEHLIDRGVLPESKRGRPVLENDTRTNAQKLGLPPTHPVVVGLLNQADGRTAPDAATGVGKPNDGPADSRDRTASPQAKAPGRKPLWVEAPNPVRGSSQAGLSAHAGGQAVSMPSTPSPGEPGSRFQPRDVTREEQAARRGSAEAGPAAGEKVGRKSLNVGAQQALVNGVPQQILNPDAAVNPDQGIAGAAAKGFTNGALAGARMNLQASAQEEPSTGPGKAVEQPATETSRTAAPVLNASGQTRQEASSEVVLEDALPGTTQPFAMDIIDAVQGKSPKAVAMNPEHAAALAALEGTESQREDDRGLGGSRFGR